MSQNITAEQEWHFQVNPWIAMIPIMLSIFMFALDETISNVALPHMAGSFSVSQHESTWIITSYLVASGVMIPTVDFLCKLMGRKQYFLLSIVIFTAASVLCGLSTSMPMMLVSRIIQGIGGGGIMPIAQAMIFEIFPKEILPLAMSVFGLGVVLAPIVGPAVGGWITETYCWPWIYFINIPVGIITFYLSVKYIEEPPYSRKQQGVVMDFSGFTFMALWLLSLQVVLEKGNDNDWFDSTFICRLFAFSMICLVIFIYIQIKKNKSKTGLINLSILRNNNFLIGTMAQVVLMGVMMASASILPSMLQSLMGYSAFMSGLSMMPRGAGCLLASIVSGVMIVKFGIRPVVVIGLIVLAAGSFEFGDINTSIALANIAIPNFTFGLGMVLAMVPLSNISCATLSNKDQTNAAGLQNLVKNVGAAIGTSIATTMISRFSQIHQMTMVQFLNEGNNVYSERLNAMASNFMAHNFEYHSAINMAQGQMYNMLKQQATLWGYVETFRYFALAVVLILPFVYLLKEDKKRPKKEKQSV